MMTKKHFIKIAKILAFYKDHMEADAHRHMVNAFAVAFKAENANFDKDRFVEACNKEGVK